MKRLRVATLRRQRQLRIRRKARRALSRRLARFLYSAIGPPAPVTAEPVFGLPTLADATPILALWDWFQEAKP